MKSGDENWDLVITSKNKIWDLDLKSIWAYKDLLFILVKRDLITIYKQTLLGPFWFIIQPIITSLIYTIVFGQIAKMGTDGIPYPLFYFSGITLWTYFSECLGKTSGTFVYNAGIFGKVYFPRLIVPLSVLISNLFRFGIQFLIFLAFWLYYLLKNEISPEWNYMIFFPLLIIIMAGLGFGFGILISSLTTKYRDLTFLVGFGIQFMMYASPIVYPLSIIPDKYKWYILINPVSSVIESFKYIFLGSGYFSWAALTYSSIFMLILLFISIIIFKKVEKNFIDTV